MKSYITESQTVYVVYCGEYMEAIYIDEDLADKHAKKIGEYYREEKLLTRLPSWIEEKEEED